MEIWTPLPLSLVGGLFLRNAWLDSGYMFFVSARLVLDTFLTFPVNVSLDPALDSRPARWRNFHVFAARRSVHGRCFDCEHCPSSWHLESRHRFVGPLHRTGTWPLSQECVRRVLSRVWSGREVARSPGVFTRR